MSGTQRIMARRGLRFVLLAPLILGWRLATVATNAIGILLALVLGILLVGLGVVLCSTIAGVLVGLPLAFAGILLLCRAIY